MEDMACNPINTPLFFKRGGPGVGKTFFLVKKSFPLPGISLVKEWHVYLFIAQASSMASAMSFWVSGRG